MKLNRRLGTNFVILWPLIKFRFGGQLPSPDDVSLLQKLLRKVAEEKDLAKSVELLGLIQRAAREEQDHLKRRLEADIERYRAVERRNWKRLIENSGLHPARKADPASQQRDRVSAEALRYLKLADLALGTAKSTEGKPSKKRA